MRNHILFGSLIIRAWTQTTELIPLMFSHVSSIIHSFQGSEMMRPLVQSSMDSEASYLAFLDKIILLLLEESIIDQQLCEVITSLTQVMLAVGLRWGQLIGSNPRTRALLSSITSACQRQLCLGSPDLDEHSITVRIVQETLNTVK